MTAVIRHQGAGFLNTGIDPAGLVTPERLTDEQRMLRDTVRRFIETEVQPHIAEIEKFNPELMKGLLRKIGELGMCQIDIPAEYDGLGLDFISSLIPAELCNWGSESFQVTFSVQTIIGLLPILYFGSEDLKRKYLPKIGSVEYISAYALTEPGSGSDALAAKSVARLSEDGAEWILTGTKQFITNGQFADIFIIFAKVDGQHFSAFVVPRDAPGFSVGQEEHKMGIKGSSTTTLAYTDCRIPKENLIGEVGQGAKIALNTLNVGRLKLGCSAVGGSKEALEVAVRYALERKQFGRAIAEFGIIREKIAEMAARVYAAESTVMRTGGLIDDAIRSARAEGDASVADAMMGGLRRFNVECAIEKVHGSETLAYCTDEAVQIHGGYGFIEEYPVARFYRDARITRLYEGTNEINRMQIAGDILKRASTGEFGISEEGLTADADAFGSLGDIAAQVARMKTVTHRLMALTARVAGAGASRTGGDQELLRCLADIIIAIYGTETAMGRAVQAAAAGADEAPLFESMTRIYASAADLTVQRGATEALMLLLGDEAPAGEHTDLLALAAARPVNVIDLRRRVAAAMIDRQGVWFS